ncbi:hypothetical protein Sru01_36840 [Sphaerisporangium rufum]|uniref:Sulfotransferase n=1 Tax=Sphaerisporangium rufum TaxID=1381558 RepID=A0A919V1K3_9ACTN|nr:sulfotransferase [Sphaerisporangium rufum]GII78702.1 hypothetical protein Sru01_36840 [Sphaerisporangium rufum]
MHHPPPPAPGTPGGPGLGFVLGTGRCGSTLLFDVLARHPDAGFPTNLDDHLRRVPAPLRRLGTAAHRRLPPGFPPRRVRPAEAQAAMAREISPMISDPFRDLLAEDVTPWLARRAREFFAGRAAAEGVRHYLHKFTGWPRAGFLHEVFPEARFVHIVRDGRAVANSWLQMSWWRGHLGPASWDYGPLPRSYAEEWHEGGRCLVHLAGIGWKILMDAFEMSRAGVPARLWLEVRYEDLLADPRKQVDVITEFLGLPWTTDFERRFARQPISAGRAEAFRRDLTPRQLAVLDRSLGHRLRQLGYPA